MTEDLSRINHRYTRGWGVRDKLEEVGINTYTPLCIKQVNSKDLLHSTRNYTQYPNGVIYITESRCCILKTSAVL